MQEKANSTHSNNLIEELNPAEIIQMDKYIDPLSDFGFSHYFGKEPHKGLLIDFLNQLFKGRKIITDLVYNKTQHKGPRKEYRKTVFDLYCTGTEGERFIIEMQKVSQDHFKDRSIFYTSNLILEQGISVNPDWNYNLPEVYFIGLMNFSFDNSHPAHYIHDVRLIEMNTNEVFYNKLGYLFVELPKFNKAEEELETNLDVWLHFLRNPNHSNRIPVYLNKRIFKKLFKIAEVSGLNEEDMNAYQQDLKIRRDNYSTDLWIKGQAEKERQRAEKERERAEKEREQIAIEREQAEKEREQIAIEREQAEKEKEKLAIEKEQVTMEREKLAIEKERLAKEKAYALKEGLKKEALEIAREMKKEGEPFDRIIKFTKLTHEDLENL